MSTLVDTLAKRAIEIHERLLEFYGEPVWRNPLPAIDELVSTILSQNTNDINRDRAFNSLRARSASTVCIMSCSSRKVGRGGESQARCQALCAQA